MVVSKKTINNINCQTNKEQIERAKKNNYWEYLGTYLNERTITPMKSSEIKKKKNFLFILLNAVDT